MISDGVMKIDDVNDNYDVDCDKKGKNKDLMVNGSNDK